MKIAFVYDVIWPFIIGGVQRRNWELARRLVRRGHDVTLYGLQHWPGDRVICREGVRLFGIGKAMDLYSRGRRSIREALYVSIKLILPLLSRRYDIVDVSIFPYFPSFSASLACLFRRSNVILTWHEVWGPYWLDYLGPLLGSFGRIVERSAVGLTRTHVAVSELTRQSLRKLGAKDPVYLVPNGVDVERIRHVRPRPSADVVFAGRLDFHKGIELLLEALYRLRASTELTCLVVGDGPLATETDHLIVELGLSNSVRRTGFVEEECLLALIKGARVFVSPSMREGFGIVVLEALACGVPVVTLRHEGNAAQHLVVEGVTGFLCDPSPDGLAEALLRALSVRDDMMENCLQYSEMYDWERITDELIRCYEKASGQGENLPLTLAT